jgi:RNA polymerase sigma-70 factor, ECF subfamily
MAARTSRVPSTATHPALNRGLAERAIGGDRDAYTELVRQSIDRSYGLAMFVLRDPERARDAVQEAYVSAWRDLASVRDPARIEAWLRRIVVRACYSELRRESRHRRVGVRGLALAHEGSVTEGADALSRRDELERGFRRLDPEQRKTLVLRHYLGLSVAEMANAMGVPLGTAKSRLNRATRAMRAVLDAEAGGSRVPVGGSA